MNCTALIDKKQNYLCNKNGNCSDCVALCRTFGGIPLCLDKEATEKLLQEEKIKAEEERIEKQKRIEEIKREKELQENILKENERRQQEIFLEKILEQKHLLEEKGLLAELDEEVVDEEFEQESLEDIECQEDSNEENLPVYIEVFFRCCCVYGKLYLSIQKSHYVGTCPKCKARLTAPAGSNAPRFGLRQ